MIFSSQRTVVDGDDGYAAMAARMFELATHRHGFVAVESARGPDGFGITVSYWESEEAIVAWKADVEHLVAQHRGREEWYQGWNLRVAEIVRESSGSLRTG